MIQFKVKSSALKELEIAIIELLRKEEFRHIILVSSAVDVKAEEIVVFGNGCARCAFDDIIRFMDENPLKQLHDPKCHA